MTLPGIDPRQLARLLRQREEMGQGPLFLESMDSAQAQALARAARKQVPPSRPAPAANVKRAAPRRSAPTAGVTALPVLPAELEAMRIEAQGCSACRLCEGRTQAVFSDGSPDARLMVVGEAPGAQEDATGLPFVGPAGKLLDLMLASVGLSRKDSVYICNVVKCRPPGNRNPEKDEIESCAPFLRRQIELVRPQAVLAVGTFSAQLLAASDLPLGKLRGEVYSYEGVPLVITYHPAALLRNSGWRGATWDDLQLLRQVMDGA